MQTCLETVEICKTYPGTNALDKVSVRFDSGRVTALLGKNGAGKSTLVKILAGTTQPTSGQILIDGRPVELLSASHAFAQGIATVYQELSLIRGLTVAENILLGRMPCKVGWGGRIIDWSAARKLAEAVLNDLGVSLDVSRRVGELGVAQQQIVEIAKAMSFNPSVLMLDEPTSALAQHEADLLFRIVRRLANNGVAVVYITHRLQELSQIVDSVTVLREGRHAGTVDFKQASPEMIVRMIFGEALPKRKPYVKAPFAETLLDVKNICRRGKLHNVNFRLQRGEILGIAGMLGSGRTELLRAIFGADGVDDGNVIIEGTPVHPRSPRQMKRRGIGLIPENRKEEALVLGMSTRTNICLASLQRVGRRGWITRSREQTVAQRLIDCLSIKLSDTNRPVDRLSGGNQQKVVVGKWLNTAPKVILFDEPTRGIDLHAKQQIFDIMSDLSRQGIGCIFVSSELEELLEVCHRILIMKSGSIVEEVNPESMSVEDLVVRCMEQESNLAAAVQKDER